MPLTETAVSLCRRGEVWQGGWRGGTWGGSGLGSGVLLLPSIIPAASEHLSLPQVQMQGSLLLRWGPGRWGVVLSLLPPVPLYQDLGVHAQGCGAGETCGLKLVTEGQAQSPEVLLM